jgi:hypothetical protein
MGPSAHRVAQRVTANRAPEATQSPAREAGQILAPWLPTRSRATMPHNMAEWPPWLHDWEIEMNRNGGVGIIGVIVIVVVILFLVGVIKL